ncbi:MAG: hypothetical protein PHW63_02425 [Alphaproteobacteria bacterium]|nr:hypothetical protein [Alphaproteobacteria bacterium]
MKERKIKNLIRRSVRSIRGVSIEMPKAEWVSALSDFGLLGLAIYGLFFTGIPREVAEALNKELAQLKTEKQIIMTQVEALQNKEAFLHTEVEKLSSVHSEYIQRVAQTFIPAYAKELFKTADEWKLIAEKSTQIDKMHDWIKQVDVIEDAIAKKDLEDVELSKLIIQKQQSIPKAFHHDHTLWMLKSGNFGEKREDTTAYKKFLDEFKSSIMTTEARKTGFDLVISSLEIEQAKLLAPDDFEKLKNFIVSYTKKHSEIYKKQLLIKIRLDQSAGEIEAEAKTIERNLAVFQDDIKALEVSLRSFFDGLLSSSMR